MNWTWEDIQPYFGLGDEPMHWIVKIFIIVLATVTLNFCINKVLLRLDDKLKQTKNPWDNMFVEAARLPLRVLIWLIGISVAVEIPDAEFDENLTTFMLTAREVGVVAIISWFLLRCVKGIEKALTAGHATKKPVDYTTANAISKLLRAAVFITAALVILQTLGFSISGVLAFGGVGGIAVGFAARDLLANLFGGLVVHLDRPFSVGDWIRSPDQNIEGTVENIGWRQTRIRTFDMRPLYVPNATFSTISVENPSRMTHRRINETIGVRYQDFSKLQEIVADIKEMIGNHDEIDTDQIYMVNFNDFGASSLDFFIYCHTKTVNWAKFHDVKQDILFQAMNIIEQHDAEVAFPTRTLHLFNENQEQAEQNDEAQKEQSAEAAREASKNRKQSTAKKSHQYGNENHEDASGDGEGDGGT
ncbi:mechanosensitive ion channel family protein [Marinomonas ostreistagni]|uniref:mechanosensitive ion channel family protein n=1 Tax=Marinomonas ostreistagni TaxID=359209 RepID=UPI00194EED00|nr:mechanosensitive ion channel family protein [Marinomonas ostreistagni]MBM6551515.1 mechanosensitive ion channel family protein [Marinomonas ostreistagni]